MRPLLTLLLFALVACNNSDQQSSEPTETKTVSNADTASSPQPDSNDLKETPGQDSTVTSPKTYSNERFKNVVVKRISTNEFLVEGQAQVFEASFSWIIEDGHEELKQGHNTTDAGAPAWGDFSFTITAEKKRANSTLHLVLFEASAKDGSRQHQLPIPLY